MAGGIAWKRLDPNRPLAEGDERYVARPWHSGSVLANMIRNGLGPVGVTGAPGIGKSTELAAAAQQLLTDRVTGIWPIDQRIDLRSNDTRSLYFNLSNDLVAHSEKNLSTKPLLSETLQKRLDKSSPRGHDEKEWRDSALAVIRSVAGTRNARPVLLIDGLEKTTSETYARLHVEALLSLREELDLVIVLPTSLVYGPENVDLLEQLRHFNLAAVPVEGESPPTTQRGIDFFAAILERRADAEGFVERDDLFLDAARSSGGVARTFLKLLYDAHAYAQMRGALAPTLADLQDAKADINSAYRRLLADNDKGALAYSHGRPSEDIPIDVRLRFLSLGLLLQYEEHGDRVFVHPLLRDALGIK